MKVLQVLFAAAAVSGWFTQSQACLVEELSPDSGVSSEDVQVTIRGSGLLAVNVARFTHSVSVNIPVTPTSDSLIRFVIPANTIPAGTQSRVSLFDGAVLKCDVPSLQEYFSHEKLNIPTYSKIINTANSSVPEPEYALVTSKVLNLLGKDEIVFEIGSFWVDNGDVKVLFRVQSEGWSVMSAGNTFVLNDKRYVRTRTPAFPLCADASVAECNIAAQAAVSMNGGISLSNFVDLTVQYIAPTKVGFLFKGTVNDQWTNQVHKSRLQLEEFFGQTVSFSYVENVVSSNALQLMLRWCVEGFDLIVPSTFDLGTAMLQATKEPACSNTRFAGLGTSARDVNDNASRAYGKVYETRYLAGAAAGHLLKSLGEETCVGFIAPFPRAVLEQVNSFLIGCREVYSECKVKLLFTGTFYQETIERDAAAFLRKEQGCRIVIQNTDSRQPQLFFEETDGFSFGIHDDLRPILGDSVLTSEFIAWTAALREFILQVKEDRWEPRADLTWGLDRDGVDISTLFSPFLSGFAQGDILQKREQLKKKEKKIFCKSSGLMRRAYKYVSVRSDVSCLRDSFEAVPADQVTTFDREADLFDEDGCIKEDLIFLTSFHSFFLEGVEILDKVSSKWGNIVVPDASAITANDQCPENLEGRSIGQGYYQSPDNFPLCSETSFNTSQQMTQCNPDTLTFDVQVDRAESCGVSLVNVELSSSRYAESFEDPKAVGPACNYVVWGSSQAVLGLILSLFGIIFNFVVILLLLKYRMHRSVRATQPVIIIFMGIGGVCLCASNLLFVGAPTQGLCIARVLIFNLSFDLIFAMLVGKIWRIFKLYNEVKKLRRITIKDMDILKLGAVLIFIDFFILMLWIIIDTPSPRFTASTNEVIKVSLGSESWVFTPEFQECYSESPAWSYMTIFYKAALILTACGYVFLSRRVPSSFVEHRFIIFSAYNTAIFAGVVLLLIGTSDPATAFVIQCVGTVIGSCIVNGSLTVPRVFLAAGIWTLRSSNNETGRSPSEDHSWTRHKPSRLEYSSSMQPTYQYTEAEDSSTV